MNMFNGTKINQLLQIWPKGTVATSSWLKKQGISSILKQKYQESQWVESIGYGAVIRKGDKVDWPGALFALQDQLQIDIHVGGKSALELLGYAHFVKFGESVLHLYSHHGKKLPLWFTNHQWGQEVYVHKTKLLCSHEGLTSYQEMAFSITISGAERAFLEMLYLVPQQQDMQECYYLLENLIDLRPVVLQALLEKVSSVKVKRLFFFLADKLNHPWLDSLDKSKISLGSGKRKIVEQGVLDKKYLITVPRELLGND
ncbi:MAG: type IV toxin-antitoxin system AbiEi family antitoxin [Proteobacteria bacterium]|nr:type IV toxin-antitoxin system AbiEi family antitoxin [Pseudomonadota bacterium]